MQFIDTGFLRDILRLENVAWILILIPAVQCTGHEGGIMSTLVSRFSVGLLPPQAGYRNCDVSPGPRCAALFTLRLQNSPCLRSPESCELGTRPSPGQPPPPGSASAVMVHLIQAAKHNAQYVSSPAIAAFALTCVYCVVLCE